MNIGAQLYTVRKFTQTPEDIAATLKKVAGIGYRYVQCSAIGPIDPHQLRDLLQENGLTCVVTHTNPERWLQEVDAVIAEHRIFGCADMGMGMMPERYRGSLEGLRTFIADFRPAVQRIVDAGMRFHYHNHDVEFARVGGRALMEYLLEEWPEAYWLMCSFWVQVGGGDPIDWLNRYGDRVKHMHLKDMSFALNQGGVGHNRIMTPVLEGNMNHAGIVEACARKGVENLLVEQDDCYDQDPFECLRISFENLRGMGLC